MVKSKKERLPFHITKDQHMLRLKLKETMIGVSKRYRKIPKRLWSSLIIVVGICSITLIALFLNGSQQTDLADPPIFNDTKNVIFDEIGELQVQVPSLPQVELSTESLSLEFPNNQAVLEETIEDEPAQLATKIISDPLKSGSSPINAEESFVLAIIYPLQREGAIITNFGWYYHPILEVWKFHQGVDLRCKKGDLVMASESGKVKQIKETDKEVMIVILEHGDGWTTTYGQISEVNVRIGDQIAKGQKLGKIGQSTTAIEPHLHFEIRQNGELTNPVEYLP
ncbi:MAG: M23 family metallopeptidase [Halanaerobiales bacterium]|nr:M23 family metallopeptidase [Halanaerobiales bacterium]